MMVADVGSTIADILVGTASALIAADDVMELLLEGISADLAIANFVTSIFAAASGFPNDFANSSLELANILVSDGIFASLG